MSPVSKVLFINETKQKKQIKLWCPLCDYLLNSSRDIHCVKEHSCCEECWMTFGQMRQDEWKEGWRPGKETLKRYKQSRRIINIDIKKILGE